MISIHISTRPEPGCAFEMHKISSLIKNKKTSQDYRTVPKNMFKTLTLKMTSLNTHFSIRFYLWQH